MFFKFLVEKFIARKKYEDLTLPSEIVSDRIKINTRTCVTKPIENN